MIENDSCRGSNGQDDDDPWCPKCTFPEPYCIPESLKVFSMQVGLPHFGTVFMGFI